MNRLGRYLSSQFIFLFFLSLMFFVLSLVLSDLLVNLSKLIPLGATLPSVLQLSVLYIPQSLSWSLSPSLLFSVSFVLGSLYAHNELVIVFGSGISLRQFTTPLFVVGVLASVFLFFWNDRGVIQSEHQRQELTRTLQGFSSKSNANVALLSHGGKLLYSAAYYNDQTKSLTNIICVWKKDDGSFLLRRDAEWADWNGHFWVFHKVKAYTPQTDGTIQYTFDDQWEDPMVDDAPESFQKNNINVSELTFSEALRYVHTLKQGGLPYAEAETEALQRLSFSFSPFVVIWVSAAIGGRFRKNILLMSLLISLLISASYVILQMIFGLLAKTGVLPPWLGANAGVFVGALAGAFLFHRARS